MVGRQLMQRCMCRCGRSTPCQTQRTRATATPSTSSSVARKSSPARSASMMPPCSQVLQTPDHPYEPRLTPTIREWETVVAHFMHNALHCFPQLWRMPMPSQWVFSHHRHNTWLVSLCDTRGPFLMLEPASRRLLTRGQAGVWKTADM